MHDWKILLDVASQLKESADAAANAEPWLRSALNRVYFSVFGYARTYAKNWLDFDPRENAVIRPEGRCCDSP